VLELEVEDRQVGCENVQRKLHRPEKLKPKKQEVATPVFEWQVISGKYNADRPQQKSYE